MHWGVKGSVSVPFSTAFTYHLFTNQSCGANLRTAGKNYKAKGN